MVEFALSHIRALLKIFWITFHREKLQSAVIKKNNKITVLKCVEYLFIVRLTSADRVLCKQVLQVYFLKMGNNV